VVEAARELMHFCWPFKRFIPKSLAFLSTRLDMCKFVGESGGAALLGGDFLLVKVNGEGRRGDGYYEYSLSEWTLNNF
jgi:hypothetical protein